MITRVLAIAAVLLLGGCSDGFVKKFQVGSANFRSVIAEVNANIAAVAPDVAEGCGELQNIAMLAAPLVATQGDKAVQIFNAADAGITAYCQTIPVDINSTANAVARAVSAGWSAYNAIKPVAK